MPMRAKFRLSGPNPSRLTGQKDRGQTQGTNRKRLAMDGFSLSFSWKRPTILLVLLLIYFLLGGFSFPEMSGTGLSQAKANKAWILMMVLFCTGSVPPRWWTMKSACFHPATSFRFTSFSGPHGRGTGVDAFHTEQLPRKSKPFSPGFRPAKPSRPSRSSRREPACVFGSAVPACPDAIKAGITQVACVSVAILILCLFLHLLTPVRSYEPGLTPEKSGS